MPIRSRKVCICTRCGKEFTVEVGDNIKSNQLKKIIYCKKCRILTNLFR